MLNSIYSLLFVTTLNSFLKRHENVRITLFLAEHNDLELMAADIGNAYLHAKTKDLVFIIAGPEFGPDLEGRVMLVVKSLYGLTTSAARWHEELSKTLRSMGFTPTKADHDLWLKDCGTHYEYLCTWVDDMIVAITYLPGSSSTYSHSTSRTINNHLIGRIPLK